MASKAAEAAAREIEVSFAGRTGYVVGRLLSRMADDEVEEALSESERFGDPDDECEEYYRARLREEVRIRQRALRRTGVRR